MLQVFECLVDDLGVKDSELRPVEFLVDKKLEFLSSESISEYKVSKMLSVSRLRYLVDRLFLHRCILLLSLSLSLSLGPVKKTLLTLRQLSRMLAACGGQIVWLCQKLHLALTLQSDRKSVV